MILKTTEINYWSIKNDYIQKNTTVQKSTIKKITLLGRDLILGLGQGFQFQRIHDPKLLILVII